MPLVTVTWLAGRTAEQKRAVAAGITDALAGTGVHPSDVWVVFTDVGSGDWAVAGRLVGDPEQPGPRSDVDHRAAQ